jgi:hypothetical protein
MFGQGQSLKCLHFCYLRVDEILFDLGNCLKLILLTLANHGMICIESLRIPFYSPAFVLPPIQTLGTLLLL